MISLRPARPEEATLLTGLCLRSKAVWGYSDEFMRACRSKLTLYRLRFLGHRIEAYAASATG
jgi:hypothetical protein